VPAEHAGNLFRDGETSLVGGGAIETNRHVLDHRVFSLLTGRGGTMAFQDIPFVDRGPSLCRVRTIPPKKSITTAMSLCWTCIAKLFVESGRERVRLLAQGDRYRHRDAALRELGRSGIAELIDRTCAYAHALVIRIGGLPGAEVVWAPTINQGLVRFIDPKRGATDQDHDRRTDEIISRIVTTGEAFFGGTTWRGKRCMRVSVCNWQTNEADVERATYAARQALGNLAS
jgi:hypothetical protein